MDPFIGEIRIFGGDFAPNQWAFCNGALMSASQNQTLCTVLGKSFGGDGTRTFGLPNLQDNVPLGAGSGAGLSAYAVGDKAGAPFVALTADQVPSHTHGLQGNPNVGDNKTPTSTMCFAHAAPGSAYVKYASPGDSFVPMHPNALTGFTGQNAPHNNIQPFLAVNFIIALAGTTPRK